MFISVLLPEPLAPINATNSPLATDNVTPFSTCKSISPKW